MAGLVAAAVAAGATGCSASAGNAAASCQNVTWDLVTSVRKVRKAMNADRNGRHRLLRRGLRHHGPHRTLAEDMSDARLLRMPGMVRAKGVTLNSWITPYPSQ
ncbi:hypothetical protein [Streptomyces sp. WM6378]|uniref:hypothetical protein n=1 Tax=Streptomyces sp. WM6378 TaxID=1415557 RepID=UPI0006AFEC95|nr:hypothetical protein [Streptomyces sp. WM6378]KOU33762.1 hypothetical protein ADK54_41730 [Streptomyces sp. WM6378]